MPRDFEGPIRRGQLIAPFGPGAMHVLPSGISVICGGLDYWFMEHDNIRTENIDKDEYLIDEWRLSNRLGVEDFYLPPDFRTNGGYSKQNITNCYLSIPFLRFPRWHYCPFCRLMYERPLTERNAKIQCSSCCQKGKTNFLVQVPIVAMCDEGHIQDFPWREWLFKTCHLNEEQRRVDIYLIAKGGTTLADQYVTNKDGNQRDLAGIMEADATGNTHLTRNLCPNEEFTCCGQMPWLGDCREQCDRPLRGSLRNAANVYFAQIENSIYIPKELFEKKHISNSEVTELASEFEKINPLKVFRKNRKLSAYTVAELKLNAPIVYDSFKEYDDALLQDALNLFWLKPNAVEPETAPCSGYTSDSDAYFRHQEYGIFLQNQKHPDICIDAQPINDDKLNRYITSISLISKLRETRIFKGFTRIYADVKEKVDGNIMIRKMLRKSDNKETWLPGYIVNGEGIFIQLNEDLLCKWEQDDSVKNRIASLVLRYENYLEQRKSSSSRQITPRFVLLHTLSHILMNRLTFECGYSTASLRERLYVSDNPETSMCGLLIYTAAGDSEGTLGGLVRMGKSDKFNHVLYNSLKSAEWCSADPVCMELGASGQGPESLNGAACHGCCLVPETSCEEFNRLLDRALVIGTIGNPEIGYFGNFEGQE